MHVAEIGSGPAVVFLHRFLEIWHSWWHQMLAVANGGFRAAALDFRGYGLSQVPAEPEEKTFKDLVDDLLEILDSFELQKEPEGQKKTVGLILRQWLRTYTFSSLVVSCK
ncbi:epoxide hydrolase 2-like isoform X2 [Coffea arabica]|uniref:Epoxide hydrolase 2-like isoform X2 n=1 Tax=Coffea arabica TaxID=13443 RepID=A0ABM4UCC4_COFAR